MIRRHIGSEMPHIPILDVGCGDLSFWHWSDKPLRWRTCHDYTGLDISPHAIYHNQIKRPSWRFLNIDICKQYIPWLNREVVFCLDVIHHIMTLQDLINLASWLPLYSNKWIFIHTWHNNPFKNQITDGLYQRYWDPGIWLKIIINSGFKNVHTYDNPNGTGALYVLKRRKVVT
jgi:hypothetical protein